jgi:two-component system OmpR family sensor kinase
MSEMEKPRTWRPLAGPPLALQIMGLLLGGLVVAQLVTLLLTLLLPPEPQPQYGLGDIARALAGEKVRIASGRPLQRIVQSGPPALRGPGWLVSEGSRHDLAAMLEREDSDVQLYFFTPLPFAGTARPPQRSVQAGPPREEIQPAAHEDEKYEMAPGFIRADFRVAQAAPRERKFPDRYPDRFPDASSGTTPTPDTPTLRPPGSSFLPQSGGIGSFGPAVPAPPSAPAPQNVFPHGGAPGQIPDAVIPGTDVPPATSETPGSAGDTAPANPPPPAVLGEPVAPARPPKVVAAPDIRPNLPVVRPEEIAPLDAAPKGPAVAGSTTEAPTETPVPVAAPARGLFGLAPAPFVEGDFVAALRLATGQWAIVQPVPEAFPNSWQRRVLLWFLIAFALVAPLGWIFARRVVRPIAGFAAAAEQLGRDPTASVLALEGPAEVGRAAHAFNRMQSRLRSFVDDRTAFVGAISHDLRTPLTRLRFRIEDAPDELRGGMLAEIDEMEQMIASVLSFIRNASEPGARERLDLRSLLEDVVEDAVFVGKDVTLEDSEGAPVEVDALGMRRLLNNLVENAVKYGDQARVRLFTEQQDVVAEIRDNGPGLPEEELERVFQPFYRTPAALASAKHGTGLGLAVCRSIARAHGGDVRLTRGAHGLVAQLRLPLVYGASA